MTTSWRFDVFNLQPIIRTGSRQVLAIGALGHDPFEAVTVRLMEEFRAEGSAVMAECDQFMLRQNSLEPLLTLQQRKVA